MRVLLVAAALQLSALQAESTRLAREPAGSGIPANIFQSFKTRFEGLPPVFAKTAARWKKLNPNWNYTYFDDAEGGQFIKDNFPSEAFKAYNDLKVGAFKADLARYCYLYMKGGVWVDLDMMPFHLDATIQRYPSFDMLLAKDEMGPGLWQGLFFATAKNPVLLKAIDLAVRNIQSHHYGCSDLEITGPRVMGSAVEQFYGDLRWVDKRSEEDYTLTLQGVRTVITCCKDAEGPIVGRRLPTALLETASGRRARRMQTKEGVSGDYLKKWCKFDVYASQTAAELIAQRGKRKSCPEKDPLGATASCIEHLYSA